MKDLPLSKSTLTVQVDDADYDELVKYSWYIHKDPNTLYARRSLKNRSGGGLFMHRQLFKGQLDKSKEVDHIDGNGLNNQRHNLQVCSKIQNNQHRRKIRLGTSKYKGVHWSKGNKGWVASIRINRKLKYLGTFDNEIDAATAYNTEATRSFGSFAHINVII